MAGDVTVRVRAGYMDDRQIVLFVELSPPARFVLAETWLRDQFGRVYRARSSFADSAIGEHIVTFDAPAPPLLLTGARLWLESRQIEREPGPERISIALSLAMILTASAPTFAPFLLNMGINYAVLLAVAAAYLGLLYLIVHVLVRPETRGPLLGGITGGVLFLALTLPTYVLIATVARGCRGSARLRRHHAPARRVRERVLHRDGLLAAALLLTRVWRASWTEWEASAQRSDASDLDQIDPLARALRGLGEERVQVHAAMRADMADDVRGPAG